MANTQFIFEDGSLQYKQDYLIIILNQQQELVAHKKSLRASQ